MRNDGAAAMETTAEDGRRAEVRAGVLKTAKLISAGAVLDCVVLDLSAQGARLRLPAMMVLPSELTLCFRGGAAFGATLRWARAQEVGVQFTGPAALVARRAAEAAEVAQRLRATGLERVLDGLETLRHFDDPGLLALSRAARAAQAELAEALERLSRGDGGRPPDVFSV